MSNNFTRCFVAIDLEDSFIKEISRAQNLVSNQNFTGKLTELGNLHLTLKFLGEISDDKLSEVKMALKEINFKTFDVRLGKIGVFGRNGSPKIVWVKLEGAEIWTLQEKIDKKLHELGFDIETKFMAHITIARVKHVSNKKGFIEYIKNIHVKPENFNVNNFKLKKSELNRIGPLYTDLEVYSAVN